MAGVMKDPTMLRTETGTAFLWSVRLTAFCLVFLRMECGYCADCGAVDGRCVACIGDECDRINQYGGYALRNIPASDEWVRIVVKCGSAPGCYGQSEFFRVLEGQSVDFDPGWISLTPEPPRGHVQITAKLEAPIPMSLGETRHVIVEAIFEDETREVLEGEPKATGTSFRSSNSSVVLVNDFGDVRAIRNGVAFVTARNRGRASVARVLVESTAERTAVTGLVLEGDLRPAMGAAINLISPGVDCNSQPCGAVTDETGRFFLAGVPAGLGGPKGLSATMVNALGQRLTGSILLPDPLVPLGSPVPEVFDVGTIVLQGRECTVERNYVGEGCPLVLDDDGTQEVVFSKGFEFPFFGGPNLTGAAYKSVWVNANGSLTFGAGDSETYDPAEVTEVLDGPPRIAPFLVDLDPSAANVACGGGIFCKEEADRFVVKWAWVPLYSE